MTIKLTDGPLAGQWIDRDDRQLIHVCDSLTGEVHIYWLRSKEMSLTYTGESIPAVGEGSFKSNNA